VLEIFENLFRYSFPRNLL